MVLSVAAEGGGIAFHYATPLTARELEWYGRFDVLVTHDPLPRAQVDALHKQGTKLALYEWSVAYYATLATPWHRTAPLLNKSPLRGHLGANDADAFYYDPASREHQRGRAEFLTRRVKAIGYDGLFFDTTTAESVHPDAAAEYRRRHPTVSYDEAFAMFLANLRKSISLIVTNQGYRAADHVLPYADWDVTESLITRPRGGKFVMRPWNDPADRWNSIAYLMNHLIAPVRKKYPRVRYAHINYVNSTDVAPIVAIARLWDAEPVVTTPDVAQMIESELLLLDLGEGQKRVERTTGAYRFYEKGFIGYNAGKKSMRVTNPRGKAIVIPPQSAVILRLPR
ncbi:MAG TPA: hypothetical protein VEK11_20490 [Thermoanaerobaculia bacterium]|nr:hypothetical protein [Thermoanaerobaculia bacterium]